MINIIFENYKSILWRKNPLQLKFIFDSNDKYKNIIIGEIIIKIDKLKKNNNNKKI